MIVINIMDIIYMKKLTRKCAIVIFEGQCFVKCSSKTATNVQIYNVNNFNYENIFSCL